MEWKTVLENIWKKKEQKISLTLLSGAALLLVMFPKWTSVRSEY